MDGQKTRKTEAARKAPLKVRNELWDKVRVLDSELTTAPSLTDTMTSRRQTPIEPRLDRLHLTQA